MTMHEVLAGRIGRGELPGAVALVARGDDVRVEVLGTTAFGGDTPMRRDTVFRIASLTKPLLAAATLRLVEDDVLDLEEPVHRLLPELAGQRVLARLDGPLDETVPRDRPVTVEDLLTMRLGFGTITEPSFDPPWPIVTAAEELRLVLGPPDPRTPWEPGEWIRRFGSLPLMHQPGTRWQYNVGSLVLGVLLARAEGKPLGDVLRERLLDPLGMHETGFFLPASRARDLPQQYFSGEASTLTGPEVWSEPPVFPSGAGGLVSTVDEYHAFARMLLRRGVHGGTRILSEKSVELMTTNRLTPEQVGTAGVLLEGSGWGFGVGVLLTPNASGAAGQYGWSGGSGTTWFNDPRHDLTAILFTQVSDVLWDGTLKDFEKAAYE